MDEWSVLDDILILLAAALALGAVCERFRQSAIVGYLAAGTLVGPHAIGLIGSSAEVTVVAELGVALLLFSIGLEFSWKRLKGMGRAALGGGVVQIVATMLLGTGIALAVGLPPKVAWALGAVVALSSTAGVLRLLVARAEIESVHGRHALGILLMQDIAVVPLVLMVGILGEGGSLMEVLQDVGLKLAGAAALVVILFLLLTRIVPRILTIGVAQRNRELPILLATVTGLGSAWGAHAFGLSPALGSFIAGMLLAESPFAMQVRADVAALRTLLVTLFFSSVGLLGDPAWFIANLPQVLALVAALVVGKALIVWMVLRLFGLPHRNALAAGLVLAQVGEFSFVLLALAQGTLLDAELFALFISATITTLFLTPFLVAAAPTLSTRIIARLAFLKQEPTASSTTSSEPAARVLLIGFGPAGQVVGEAMVDSPECVTVIDLNPGLLEKARLMGFQAVVGDATHADTLEHLHVGNASAAVITIPDPSAARQIVGLLDDLAPEMPVIVRGRYHRFLHELESLGGPDVVDEERVVGARMAARLRRRVGGDLVSKPGGSPA